MIIPKHIQIETVGGLCTARCIMCTINKWTRTKSIMSNDVFAKISKKFLPYVEQIEYITLHDCGEPLLDKELPTKVKMLKDWGFNGTGFASNCTLLKEDISIALLDAGLDTIICSVDGIKKETHEAIRIGTIFEEIVANVKSFIKLRNRFESKTRIIIRFIRQALNEDELVMFKEYWAKYIDTTKDDKIVYFDIHNWGDAIEDYQNKNIKNTFVDRSKLKCIDLYERILIHNDGSIGFCSADYNGYYDFGTVLEKDPIEIFNNEIYNYYRKKMEEGKILELKYCKTCTIPLSRALKGDLI